MVLYLLAFLGGALTIASPCILPVLPFVFANSDKSFLRRGLPMLIGMAATFAAVATLAAFGGGWAARANEFGRWAALALLAVFGLTLLFPRLSERLTGPLVALGGRLSEKADHEDGGQGSSVAAALLLGVATGFLWAPCAGPILGLILTGAALQGASAATTLLLLSYALGAATSLALALLVGGRVFAAMKRMLGAGEWIRRGFGAAVVAAVAVIALGADTGFLTRLSLAQTSQLEQGLLDRFHAAAGTPPPVSVAMNGEAQMAMRPQSPAPKEEAKEQLPVEGNLPSLSGAVEWLNSPPLTAEALKGKVVLVDFWTYSCINCLRSLPYVRAWAEKYHDKGLVVIGVHAPEFAFEKVISNVQKAVADLHIDYPVAIDNDYAIWRAFNNNYWPAHYFIDAKGRIRAHHFGEGDYDGSEKIIQQLLAEAGQQGLGPEGVVKVSATGAQAAADMSDVKSPETYLGYGRAENFASPGGQAQDKRHVYTMPDLSLNQWALAGAWTVKEERADLGKPGGAISFRFHARDLHLVLGPGADGKPARFRVTIDGKPPGDDHGADINAQGEGVVTGERLYQLVRQQGAIGDRLFRIEFLDPGVRAYAFTFG
jgi:cytochrome c biogenesis protein CcdA/thiol-disulfide isomerase/thioredoxin